MQNLQVVSITRQGQLTIPKKILREFGIVSRGARAVVRRAGDEIIIKPRRSFLDFGGALKSKIRLTDAQLRKAREAFEKEWPRPMPK